MSVFLIFFVSFAFFIVPVESFAWGPTVHVGVSLSILEQLPDYLKILLYANINEYLYGALAPDFIVGKSFSKKDRHSHNWDVGFVFLEEAKDNRQRAFAFGYLTHLASDAVAHGIIVNSLADRFKNAKHAYIELVADSICDSAHKELAKRVLSKYNSDLDSILKDRVDSVLFSFGLSKLIFKGIIKVSVGRKGLKKVLFNPKVVDFFSVDMCSIKEYIELSKQFSIDVVLKGKDSPVTKLDAISE